MVVQGLVRKALESPVVPALLLAASVFLIGMAATAGGEAWDQALLPSFLAPRPIALLRTRHLRVTF